MHQHPYGGHGHGSEHALPEEAQHEHMIGVYARRFFDVRETGALRAHAAHSTPEGQRALERILTPLEAIDECCDLARRVTWGDKEARDLLAVAIEKLPPPTVSRDYHQPPQHPESNAEVSLLSSAAFLDLLAGLTYAARGDGKILSDWIYRMLDSGRAAILWSEILSTELAAAARVPPKIRDPLKPLLRLAFDADGSLRPPPVQLHSLAARAQRSLVALEALAVDWLAQNPIGRWLDATRIDTNNSCVVSVHPSELRPCDELILIADATPFDAERPKDVGVFFGNRGIEGDILSWGRKEIRVCVPDIAGDAPVYIARRLTDEDRHAVRGMAEKWLGRVEQERLEATLHTMLQRGFPREVPDKASVIRVIPPPRIENVYLTDRFGRVIEAGSKERAVRIHWRVQSLDPNVQVTLQPGQQPAQVGGGAEGVWDIPATLNFDELVVTVRDAQGEAEWSLATHLAELLGLIALETPPIVRLVVPSTWDHPDPTHAAPPVAVTVRIRAPFRRDLRLRVTSSNPDRVRVVQPSITISHGSTASSFLVQGSSYGAPEEPAATLDVVVDEPGLNSRASVEVWIEPAGGRWIRRGDLGIVGVHAALFANGKILFFSPARQRRADGSIERDSTGEARWNLGHAFVEIEVWDSVTGMTSPSPMPPRARERNLFCAGHVHLHDGRLLVAAGHINFPPELGETAHRHIHIYDPQAPAGAAWTRMMPELRSGRWYPTCTVLPDRRVLIVSGASHAFAPAFEGTVNFAVLNAGYGTNTTFELFDPERGLLDFDDRTFMPDSEMGTYPFVYVLPAGAAAPDGAIIMIERDRAHLYSYHPNSTIPFRRAARTYMTQTPSVRTFPTFGSAVLLPLSPDLPQRARILVLGGSDEVRPRVWSGAPATNTAEVFEYDAREPLNNQPNWRSVLRMRHRRFMSDATLLPDGNVLITGGSGTGYTNENSDPVFAAELFVPTTGVFHEMARATVERRYHSTTLLLPDATVLCAGSTGNFPPGQPRSQLALENFQPPYLWRGPRPVILSAPGAIGYGQEFRLTADLPDGTQRLKASLIKLTSVTHANNMDQRNVGLRVVSTEAPDIVTLLSPPNGAIAPPGDYMLFLTDSWGVPSRAHFLRLT